MNFYFNFFEIQMKKNDQFAMITMDLNGNKKTNV
jgi:hypothetical protein